MTDTPRARDREGLEVLRFDECLELIASAPVGRLAFMAGGGPVILPVNHVLEGTTIGFKTARGSKLEAATMARTVAFEVDGYDEDSRTGWSVLVRGTADVIWEDELIERFEAHDLHPWADGAERPFWVVLHASDVTGRRIVHDRRPGMSPD